MGSVLRFRLICFGVLLVAIGLGVLTGCAGVSSGSQPANPPSGNGPSSGQLAVTPSTLSFGNVTVGNSSVLTGTLTASQANVTVSSAAWNGQGYSVSGITFPVTVTAGKSINYSVTFAPQATGTAPGSISFVSNAANSPSKQTLSGDGTQSSQQPHSVALSWDPSTSSVVGYNIYRGTQSGGPYSKLNSSLLPGTSYSDASVQSGMTYYYVATAVDSNNQDSAYSNQATAVIPPP